MAQSVIGAYGAWAASIVGDRPGALSFRNEAWTDVDAWRPKAVERLMACLAQPDTGGTPQATVHRQFAYDGLHVEMLSWQLPYGPPTEAVFLKPEGATGRLPGVLALHDHAGKKYFGRRKISRTAEAWHPLMLEHYAHYYGGVPWANEIAKQGYAVLIHDAFPFASRRVRLADVPDRIREGLSDEDPDPVRINSTWRCRQRRLAGLIGG